MPAAPPNILLLVGDHHHWRHLGCYGHPVVKTPALDGLAARGVRFENAFCQTPLCMPSRSSFHTGMYPHATRVMHNPNALAREIPTLAEMLSAAGYDCAGFGHLGGEGLERGMRVKCDLPDEPLRSAWAREMKTIVLDAGALYPTQVGELKLPLGDLFDTRATDMAVAFLDRGRREPFFLNLNFYNPHPPFFIPRPYCDMYDPADVALPPNFRDSLDGKPANMAGTRLAQRLQDCPEADARRALAHFYGKVSYVDDQARRVLAALDRHGLRENTVVLYIADHGDYAGEHGLFCKTGEFYEPMVHVPWLIAGPSGFLPAGRAVKGLVELVDLAPTILEAAGIARPERMHGAGRLALARGETEQGARLALAETRGPDACTRAYAPDELRMARQGAYGSGSVSHRVTGLMARDERYKLCFYADGFVELYDLLADPWETQNVAEDGGYRLVRAELTALALQRQVQTWAPVVPESDLNYHTKAVWPDCLPEDLLAQRRAWEARRAPGPAGGGR